MKALIASLALMILFVAPPLYSQKPVQDTIPQLKEWWVAPSEMKGLGRYGVSYIPNFYHGKDAMGVSVKSGMMETWLNRFPGDTENVFTWKGGSPVLQGDFNGDGITDYFGGGYIYKGIKNGEPPDTATVNYSVLSPDIVADINHDGYDDLLWGSNYKQEELAIKVLYGASDLSKMKEVYIKHPPLINALMTIENSFIGADGDLRFIAFSIDTTRKDAKWWGYVLFRCHWNKSDTIPNFEKLSEVIRYKSSEIPFQRGSAIYTSKYTNNKFFIVRESVNMTQQNNIIIYDMTQDAFKESSRMYFSSDRAAGPHVLHQSIDMDSTEDWLLTRPNFTIEFHSGGNILDTAIYSQYYNYCNGDGFNVGNDIFEVIGDVNGDGIKDLAVASSSNAVSNCFRIILSKNKTTGTDVIIDELSHITFNLAETKPYPLSRNRISTLQVILPHSGIYNLNLYNLQGKAISKLNQQEYDKGQNNIIIDLSNIPLESGGYLLRLSDNKGLIIGQRTIIIE